MARTPDRIATARGLLLVALLTGLLLPLTARGSATKITSLTVGPTARTVAGGRVLYVAGRYQCPQNERLDLRVTVFQAGPGALASGKFHGICSGGLRRLTQRLEVAGTRAAPFRPGFARACSFAVTRRGPAHTDLRSLCNGLTLR